MMRIYHVGAVIGVILTLATPNLSQQSAGTLASDTRSTSEIDGAQQPDAIPDVVAFRHFIGVLAAPEPGLADIRRRSHIENFFRANCDDSNDDRTLSAEQITKLLKVADDLNARLKPIDADATLSADMPIPRDRVVQEAIASLEQLIDADAAGKIRRHLREHMKPRI